MLMLIVDSDVVNVDVNGNFDVNVGVDVNIG